MNNTESQARIQNTALFMVLLNGFTTPMMLSAANVALPSIARDLGTNAVILSWIPMAFLMASAMFVLIFGRIADMYGRKRIFVIGTASVILTSVLAASSINAEMLIIARFLQGVSAAMLYATQIAIVSSIFPPAKRGHAIGMTVSAIYLGLTCGPVIGGYLIEWGGWRTSFIFHIPLAFIVLWMALFHVKGEWRAENAGIFDIKGAAIYSGSIVLLCAGVSLLPGITSSLLVIAGISGIFLFTRHARNTAHPVFNVRLFFENRVFTFSCLASFILYTATFANVVLISLYLQYLKNLPASTAGLFMMIQPLTMAVFSPLSGKLSDHFEPRVIASAGMILTATGLVLMSLLNGVSSMAYLATALFITGLGFSLFSSPNSNAIMGSVEKGQYGIAAGSIATMRVLGQMSSMVLVTLMFALIIGQVQIMPENYPSLQLAIQLCFMIASVLCIPGLFFSLVRGKLHGK